MYKILLLLYLIYASSLYFSDVDAQAAALVLGSASDLLDPLTKLVRYSLFAYLAFNLFYIGRGIGGLFVSQGFIFILFLVAAFSALYSIDKSRSIIDIVNVSVLLFVPLFLTKKVSREDVYNITFVYLFAIVMAGSLAALMGSKYALSTSADTIGGNFGLSKTIGAWRGFSPTKNGFSGEAACALAFCINIPRAAGLRIPMWIRLCAAAWFAFVLVKTQSAGALVAVVVAQSLVLFYSLAVRARLGKVITSTYIPLILAIISMTAVTSFSVILTVLGKDPTLTGRVKIWEALTPIILSHPFGLGYGTSSDDFITDIVSQNVGVKYAAIDNAYVILALEVGWPVALAYIIWLIVSGIRKSPSTSSDSAVEMFLPVYMLALGCVEKSGGPYLGMPFALLLLLNSYSRSAKPASRRAESYELKPLRPVVSRLAQLRNLPFVKGTDN